MEIWGILAFCSLFVGIVLVTRAAWTGSLPLEAALAIDAWIGVGMVALMWLVQR